MLTPAKPSKSEAQAANQIADIVDLATGRLRVDSQSREYRRLKRREWLRIQGQRGWKRIDLWLSPAGYERLLTAMKPNEPYGACIERILEGLPE